MPELPEVETVRSSLAQHLLGKTVVAVEASPVRLRWPLEVEALGGLSGLRLDGLARRGKYLVFLFPGRVLVCHLGMSGRLLLDFSGAGLPPHTHAVFVFTGGVRLLFVDPRRFGLLAVFPSEAWEKHPLFSRLGPEPFAVSAVEAKLLAAKARRTSAVRDVLLDQEVVAGVGNIYANEALFAAGIRPQTPIRIVSRKKLSALASSLAKVMARALAAGGTTLGDGSFRDALGDPGFFAVELAVYGREGQPCPGCGTPVRRVVLSARSAYYCPRCQR